ncbi:putative concanavalin A-like lectin/glucanase domain-containing protein [Rosa chinensis]|uniref:Putative concanavalin A-like lectin/glucanase domain-containing protein n=1 Tax=Rosa chinensis TaxID=74649 RepID=A0A2P6RS27_ROSCH|nr:putative concanavalin A-like lectin/glucanase domain-containing protein [Rosa chinensis]
MQVFGAIALHASTLMLRVYNGSLTYYRAPVLVTNIYDKWFKINVVHDVDAAKVRVYIDGCLKIEANGRGGTSHAFKCGVYAQMNDYLHGVSLERHQSLKEVLTLIFIISLLVNLFVIRENQNCSLLICYCMFVI